MDKAIFELHSDNRTAVVIDHNHEEAKIRADLHDPEGGWLEANIWRITPCRGTLTPRLITIGESLWHKSVLTNAEVKSNELEKPPSNESLWTQFVSHLTRKRKIWRW